jgi:hypothetical protein
MPDAIQQELAQKAEQLYTSTIRSQLEPQHNGRFLAIEPVSGEYFLGSSLSEAIEAAREKYPDRLAYALRVGARPAVHIGTW